MKLWFEVEGLELRAQGGDLRDIFQGKDVEVDALVAGNDPLPRHKHPRCVIQPRLSSVFCLHVQIAS